MPRLLPRRVAVVVAVAAAILGATGAGASASGNAGGRVRRDVVWRTVDGERLAADIFLPSGNQSARPAVLLVHGGGWSHGDKSVLSPVGRRLAAAGYVAVSVNYRLVPEHPFPAAVDDVQAAVRWMRKARQIDKYRIDPRRIGVLGASAGGQLGAMIGTLGEGALDVDARVAAVVTWSGPMDLTADALEPDSPDRVKRDRALADLVARFLDCVPASCPDTATEASPVTHVDATDAAMLVVNADDELMPLRQAQAMADALSAAGVAHDLVIVPGHRHASGYSDAVWDETVAFFEGYLATVQ